MKSLCCAAIALVALTGPAVAGKPRAKDAEAVALLPLRSAAVGRKTLKALDSLLLVTLDELGPYDVISPDDISSQLKVENMKDALGCNDTRCAAEIGGALGARFIVSGSVEKLGKKLVFTLSLIDTREQKARGRGQAKIDDDEGLYDQGIDAAVRSLLGLAAPTTTLPQPGSVSTPVIAPPPPNPRAASAPMDPMPDPFAARAVPADRAKLEQQLATLERLLPQVQGPERTDIAFRKAELLNDLWYKTGETQKLELAISVYENIRAESPSYARLDEVLFSLAYARQRLGRTEESLNAAKEIIKKFPTSHRVGAVYWMVGESFLGANEADKAAAAFEKVLSDPQLGVFARTRLVEMARARGDGEAVRRYCSDIPASTPSTDAERQVTQRLQADCGR